MKQFILLLFLSIIIFSCKNNGEEIEPLPVIPTSLDAVMNILKTKNYTATKIATLSPFEMDKENPYNWIDEEKDTMEFAKKFMAEMLSISLKFINDTVVVFMDGKRKIETTYKLDTTIKGEDEKPGIKLRLRYLDSTMSFLGVSEPMFMTPAFQVLGIDEKKLLLQTSYSYNRRKVVVLFKSE